MRAGRELDALVAEKVMGWHDVKLDKDPIGSLDFWDGLPTPDAVYRGEVPPYSTDIAAAWQVMEKLRGDGYKDVVITTGTDDGLWSVGIHRREAEWHEAFGIDPRGRSMAPVAHDESLPLAICLAALPRYPWVSS